MTLMTPMLTGKTCISIHEDNGRKWQKDLKMARKHCVFKTCTANTLKPGLVLERVNLTLPIISVAILKNTDKEFIKRALGTLACLNYF